MVIGGGDVLDTRISMVQVVLEVMVILVVTQCVMMLIGSDGYAGG